VFLFLGSIRTHWFPGAMPVPDRRRRRHGGVRIQLNLLTILAIVLSVGLVVDERSSSWRTSKHWHLGKTG